MSGDFDVRVKLYALDAPARTLRYYRDTPQTAAGLHVSGGNYGVGLYRWMAVHKHNGFLQDGMQDCGWLACHYPNGGSGRSLDECEPGRSLHLRVVRKGKEVAAHTSPDGENWKAWPVTGAGPGQEMVLPETVTVGLFVGQTTSQACAASFADFVIGKP